MATTPFLDGIFFPFLLIVLECFVGLTVTSFLYIVFEVKIYLQGYSLLNLYKIVNEIKRNVENEIEFDYDDFIYKQRNGCKRR